MSIPMTLDPDVREWFEIFAGLGLQAARHGPGFEAEMLKLVGAMPQETELMPLQHEVPLPPDERGVAEQRWSYDSERNKLRLEVAVVDTDTESVYPVESILLAHALERSVPQLAGNRAAPNSTAFIWQVWPAAD